MEDGPTTSACGETWADQFSRSLDEQRARVHEFLAARREAWQRARVDLASQAAQLGRDLDEATAASARSRQELELKAEEASRQAELLGRLKGDLEAARAAWDEAQQRGAEHYRRLVEEIRAGQESLAAREEEVHRQRRDLEAAQAALHKEQQVLVLARQEHAVQTEHVAALHRQLEARIAESEAENQRAAAEHQRTESQRRHIAQEFKAQRARRLREIDRLRIEVESRDTGESGRLERQLRGVEHERDRLQESLKAAEQRVDEQLRLAQEIRYEQQRLQQQFEQRERQIQEQSAELETARRRQGELAIEAEAARQRESEFASQLAAARGRLAEVCAAVEESRARETALEARWRVAAEGEARLREELETAQRRQREAAGGLEATALREAEAVTRLEAARVRLAELGTAMENARAGQAGMAAELESARRQLDELRRQGDAASASGRADAEELASLRAERDRLAENLAATEARMAGLVEQLSRTEERLEAVSRDRPAGDSGDEFRRRYELAVDDVRDLKARNDALQKELAAARSAAGPSKPAVSGLDWEAEKRRILAALESDFDENDEEQGKERLKIEEVVQKTEQALSAKVQEIEELKQLLENQTANLGSVAVGAAALGEILDKDEIIREERESLRRLQTEWEEKLRQAEIELSVERAKLARQRVELEEKHRSAERPPAGSPAQAEADLPEKPARGRWRARLGLKDAGEE